MMKQFVKKRIGTILFYTLVAAFIFYGWFYINQAKKNALTEKTYDYQAPKANAEDTGTDGYERIAGSGNLELYFNAGRGTIRVKNTDSGYIWKSIAEEEDYPTDKLNKQWKSYLKSMITVSYNNKSKRDVPPAVAYGGDCDYIKADYMENGVQVKYGFTGLGLFVKVEYVLDNGRFIVRIPYKGLEEHIQYCITALEIMPFFGAAGNETEGYLLYPDGSGALSVYGKTKDRPSKIKQGQLSTYSDKNVSIEGYINPESYERYTASLPVYGIKNNGDAVLAAVTEGAEDTGIMTYPSGIVVDLNRINFNIYVRNVFNIDISGVAKAGNAAGQDNKEIQRVDEEIIRRDREITFFFLSGDEANYSRMAGVYRSYLTEKKLLGDTIEEGSKMPLALEFLMGAAESGMIFDKYITMTSFDNLITIFKRLKEQGAGEMKVVLTSWQKGGENYPDYWPAAGQIGGFKGLKKINRYMEENPGIDLFLQNNFTFAIKENGGFSATDDIVYNGVSIPVTAGHTQTWYLLNPQVTYNRAMDFIGRLKEVNHIGIGYEYLGRIVYPDYNKASPFTRNETIQMWRKLFEDTKASGHKTATEGFNQYTYSGVDYLYGLPLQAYGLEITDYSVPFVPMVLSGRIPYSSMAGNLSYDLDIQKLQWIEYGALPFFRLTWEDSVLLKETEYNSLFTSTYDKWESRVVSVYEEFRENFSALYGRQMTLHEILDTGVVKVGYENGTLIYINYNTTEIKAEGIAIPAKGYVKTSREGE